MLILLSPSKTLDFENAPLIEDFTQPRLLEGTEALAGGLKELSAEGIGDLMKVSEKISELNYRRFQEFSTPFTTENAKQALMAFKGDVYTDFELDEYSREDFMRAQREIRILSGFYGVLRPLDLMQPYRLEMHTKFGVEGAKNLYQFWGDRVTEVLNRDLMEDPEGVVVNLASMQYFDVLNKELLNARVVTPVFKEKKGDAYKIVALFAKRARGMMANFAVREGLDEVEGLKEFTVGGYAFNEALSQGDEWVFTR